MEVTGAGTSELPEFNIDQLVENNFELLQAGINPTVASPKRSNPARACQHCGWTAQGARQIFVNHIIGEAGKGRRNICTDVPPEVKLLFQNASSKTFEVVNSEPEYTIPAVDDKYLSTIDNKFLRPLDKQSEYSHENTRTIGNITVEDVEDGSH